MTNPKKQLKLWTQGCAHLSADKTHGRESLADAIRQSQGTDLENGEPFDWDICINVGDYSAAYDLATDEEGEEIVRQYSALGDRRREDIYSICGNHDRSGLDEPEGMWFQKWLDPFGENTKFSGVDRSRYKYPITGSWERYSFEVGNVLFLMMSDVNERSQTIGRGPLGGNPGGVVTQETFDWWVDMVERHKNDRIIVTVHHYVLKDTTVCSGDWEGMSKDKRDDWQSEYHGMYEEGTPIGASYLYWVGGERDSKKFETYLENNPGAVDIWIGGHTHTNPDDKSGNKSHIETKYGGTTFINVAALTRHFVANHAMPHSRLLTFTEGSQDLVIGCYMHTSEYRPQGWYQEKETTINLSQPFIWGD